MRYPLIIAWIGLCLMIASRSSAQDKLSINLPKQSYYISELISELENQSDYFFSYNPEVLSESYSVYFPQVTYSLEEIIGEWNTYYPYDLVRDDANQKIILTRSESYRIQGIVVDSFSGELMQDVSIISSRTNGEHTNGDGYFSLMISATVESLIFSHVGYDLKILSKQELGGSGMMVLLKSKEQFLEIVILDTPIRENQFNQIHKHTREQVEQSFGISGQSDVLSYIKQLPSVSVGSEGQNGYNVRGGSNEQNLILLDGFPIYEASHLGGLSSIFLTDAIKGMDFYSSGFPARYGGKLSSVLDVRLKEGNRNQFERGVTIGLEGIQAKIEGPLSKKLSINLNAKKSYFSEIARPYLTKNLGLSDLNLNYEDYYAKASYWFNPSSRLTVSGYLGNDRIRLQRDFSDLSNSVEDFNRIAWGNKLIGLQWHAAVDDKLFVNLGVGYTQYKFRSVGSYAIQFINEMELPDTSSYTILTSSVLSDQLLKASMDYYSDNLGKFKLGGTLTKHRNEPTIVEEESFLSVDSTLSPIDTIYNTIEAAIFLENELQIGKHIKLFSGLRYEYFDTGNSNYHFLNPRIRLQYSHKNYAVSGSYSKLNQFTHLLANPGPGLPSDLWVPSTDNLRPQSSDNYDISYNYTKNRLRFGASVFYKNYENLIDYDNPSDIIYSFIINAELYNVEANNVNWEERVTVGSGESYGVELYSSYSYQEFSINLGYTLSKATRRFSSINQGETFPFKFDRRHNLSLNARYKISDHHSIRANFAYGTGNAFTFTDTRILGPNGVEILIAPTRNSYRVPAFHHLDFSYLFEKDYSGKTLSLNIGVYNVYNRLNTFYVYYQESRTQAATPRTVSIYPILPHVNVGWTW